jgi:hypothetical protein
VATEGETLELALREGAPLDVDAVARFAAHVEAFTEQLEQHAAGSL